MNTNKDIVVITLAGVFTMLAIVGSAIILSGVIEILGGLV